jgi:hypothetical protein
MKRFANASESPWRRHIAPAKFAGSRDDSGKALIARLFATSMKRAHTEEDRVAELTHEQLWKVCQLKSCDYDPYKRSGSLRTNVIPIYN